MKTKVLLSVAGLAACGAADAQVRPEIQTAEFSGQVHKAVRATAITGLTVDGQYVYGQTIELGQGNTNRITGTIAYDAAQLDDTDLDGLDIDPVCAELAPHSLTGASSRYWFGADFSWQAYAEDIIPASGTEGGTITEFVFLGSNALCDGGAGTTSEVLQVVLESWEGFDNFPDLDGSDGEFGDTPDGLGFPASQSDTDGDTFVDEFLGGIILTYADTDTDGDTVPDEQLSAGAAGYGIFYATGLDVLDTPLTSNLDMWAGGTLVPMVVPTAASACCGPAATAAMVLARSTAVCTPPARLRPCSGAPWPCRVAPAAALRPSIPPASALATATAPSGARVRTSVVTASAAGRSVLRPATKLSTSSTTPPSISLTGLAASCPTSPTLSVSPSASTLLVA